MARRHLLVLALAACSESTAPLQTAEPGVVFTYPVDGQLDVPTGTRLVVTFSDPVDASALGSCTGLCVKGPDGPLVIDARVVGDGRSVEIVDAPLTPGTTYEIHAGSALAPTAANLPTGALVTFTTRSARPRAARPVLVAVNGGAPSRPDSFRPMFEASTIRLVFSEPLDPRGVALAPGSIELVNQTTSSTVPATVLHRGIHVAIDPDDDLVAGQQYLVRLGDRLVDLAGQPIAPTTFSFTPLATHGPGASRQLMRTRQAGDAGPAASRAGTTPNVIVMEKPLIGREECRLLPATLAAELGDPKALGGPIAFTLRKGQRMKAAGLAVALGGEIPLGLDTGEIHIELLTDAGGRIYRNPHQAAEQRPENDRAPLYVDLSLDAAVYAIDATGNAVMTQTVLGVQAAGTVIATDGVLAIESVTAMELPLLGVTEAPASLVLELITDPAATMPVDLDPPALVASAPAQGSSAHAVDAGIELIFNEPIDLARARDELRLETATGTDVPAVIESHGAAIVVRPVAPLAYGTLYRVVFGDVADLAGNVLPATSSLSFTTPALASTDAPATVAAVYPGAPCALVGATATTAGRCAAGRDGDDPYRPFTIPANEAIEVAFTQPLRRSSVVRGTACGSGAVRIEQLDAAGNCVAPLAGSLHVRERSFSFVPDAPWSAGTRYRLTLVSGGDDNCGTGELCGANGVTPNFDPLGGTDNGEAGGPALVIELVGAASSSATFMLAHTAPFTDVNGNGFRESSELARDDNRAALRVVSASGIITDATFTSPDCLPNMPGVQACMYLGGAMPVRMEDVTTSCPLPDGTTAPVCMPVAVSPQVMYATSVGLDATALITISNDTGTSIMRVRDGAAPVLGYIVERDGKPTMLAKLDLYMDAPDLSIPLSSHDLHSKPLTVSLAGPVTFEPDGRIAISLTNTEALPVTITIDAPLVGDGIVNLEVPAGEMKLRLLSPALRGGSL